MADQKNPSNKEDDGNAAKVRIFEELQGQISTEKEIVRTLSHQLQEILNSRSWKITAPMRYCAKQFSELRQIFTKRLTPKGRVQDFSRQEKAALSGNTPPLNKEDTKRPSYNQRQESHINQFLNRPTAQIIFPHHNQPLVSIVIPTFNRAALLLETLSALVMNTDIPYEVIVVDDCSSDNTPALLDKTHNISIVRNQKNQDFIVSCNLGAQQARGTYVLFLNNDVRVTSGWLRKLVETVQINEDCLAVGPKIVQPDGYLQECGSILWPDGTTCGYGRGDYPYLPQYNFVREVDFCSGACLLVDRVLFERLGGFDELYRPAYYEEADLGFAVRKAGYKVLVQPAATVCHLEFGTNSTRRALSLMDINRKKFRSKWADELSKQALKNDILGGRDRRRMGERALILIKSLLPQAEGMGENRQTRFIDSLVKKGFLITVVPTDEKRQEPAAQIIDHVQQNGIEIFYGGLYNVNELLQSRYGFYNKIFLLDSGLSSQYSRLLRRSFPQAEIIDS